MANLDAAINDYDALKKHQQWSLWSDEKKKEEVGAVLKKYDVTGRQLVQAMGADEAQVSPPSGKSASPPFSLNLAPNRQVDPNAARMAGGMAGGTIGAAVGGPLAPFTALLGGGLGSEGAGQGAELINQYVLGSETPQESGVERTMRAATNVGMDMAFTQGGAKIGQVLGQARKGLPASGMVPKTGVTTAQLRKDFTDLGVSVKGAMLALRPGTARPIEALSGLPTSSGTIVKSFNKTSSDIAGVMDETLYDIGKPGSRASVSREIVKDTSAFKDSGRAESSKRYAEFFSTLPKNARINSSLTKRAFAELQDDLGGNPVLMRYANLIAKQGGKLTVNQAKKLRSYVGERTGDPMVLASQGITTGAMKRLYGALSSDLEGAAVAAGPDAIKRWQSAGKFYKFQQEELEMVDTVLKDKMVSGTFDKVWAGAKDGPEVLQTLKRSMTEDTWNKTVRLKMWEMGQSTPGQRGVVDEFSMSRFLTRYNDISVEAKNVMFEGASALRERLDKFARVSASFRVADKVRNSSNSSHNSAWQELLQGNPGRALAVGAVRSVQAAVGTVAVATGLPYATAKLMTWEPFINWATQGAQIVQKNPNGLAAHFGRLAAIAKAQPAMAEHIHAFMQAYSDSVERKQSPTI